MKKIFTLFGIAAICLSAAAEVTNIATDDYPYNVVNVNEEGQANSKVELILNGVIPKGCDITQTVIEMPENAVPVLNDSWTYSEYCDVTKLGMVSAAQANAFLENKTSYTPGKGVKNNVRWMYLGIDHSLTARSAGYSYFPDNGSDPTDLLKFQLDLSKCAEGANYVTVLPGASNTIWSCRDIDNNEADQIIYTPANETKLFLYNKDGIVSAVETINANEVPAAQKGIYNMMGVKVNRAEPGQMYIIDGKKVIPTSVIER